MSGICIQSFILLQQFPIKQFRYCRDFLLHMFVDTRNAPPCVVVFGFEVTVQSTLDLHSDVLRDSQIFLPDPTVFLLEIVIDNFADCLIDTRLRCSADFSLHLLLDHRAFHPDRVQVRRLEGFVFSLKYLLVGLQGFIFNFEGAGLPLESLNLSPEH